jgi:hypothetical protein
VRIAGHFIQLLENDDAIIEAEPNLMPESEATAMEVG